MPAPETTGRLQTMVLWEAHGTDDYGQIAVLPPIELFVRWNTKRTESLDPLGNTVALDAVVIVDRKVTIGSIVWLGELADWLGTGSGSGMNDSELHEVITYSETPDIRSRVRRRELGLRRYKDALPEPTV